MKSEGEQSHSEIIIVRRGGHGDHDEHHGGAWKIAYADFVTAMMAFFLVMWLVNAKDEETREAIANYFNPIKLTDSQTSSRSIQKKMILKRTRFVLLVRHVEAIANQKVFSRLLWKKQN